MALAINWARRVTARLFDGITICCITAFATTFLWRINLECLGLLASTTACGSIPTFGLNDFEFRSFALAPFAPSTHAIFSAARQLAGALGWSCNVAGTSSLALLQSGNPLTAL
jgi:hypothetical protein